MRVLTRTFNTLLHLREDDEDGRTVEGRIVPYNEPTEIVEHQNGEIVRYQEQFLPGSFYEMVRGCEAKGNASWVSFVLDHENSFDSRIGYAQRIREDEDGAYATFRLYDTRDLPKVRSILTESHTGLSVEFYDRAAAKVINDVVSRVQVHLQRVAATPTPAYATAGIVAMRDGELEIPRPNLESVRAMLAELKRDA